MLREQYPESQHMHPWLRRSEETVESVRTIVLFSPLLPRSKIHNRKFSLPKSAIVNQRIYFGRENGTSISIQETTGLPSLVAGSKFDRSTARRAIVESMEAHLPRARTSRTNA